MALIIIKILVTHHFQEMKDSITNQGFKLQKIFKEDTKIIISFLASNAMEVKVHVEIRLLEAM